MSLRSGPISKILFRKSNFLKSTVKLVRFSARALRSRRTMNLPLTKPTYKFENARTDRAQNLSRSRSRPPSAKPVNALNVPLDNHLARTIPAWPHLHRQGPPQKTRPPLRRPVQPVKFGMASNVRLPAHSSACLVRWRSELPVVLIARWPPLERRITLCCSGTRGRTRMMPVFVIQTDRNVRTPK